MKITYMSDLHLELDANVDPGTGDVLVLAGDILVAKNLVSLTDYAKHRKDYKSFYEKTKKNFKKIYYIHGNHEPYGMDIDIAKEYTSNHLPLWDTTQDAIELDDKHVLIQRTLWTDMNKRNRSDMSDLSREMNDFQIIWKDGHIFKPWDAVDIFDKHLKDIEDTATKYKDKTIVVVTHHSPSPLGFNKDHQEDVLTCGYGSDLGDFIKEHSNIRYWIHGHTHIQKTYDVHQCKVLSNARGYKGYEDQAETFGPKVLELP